MSHFLILQDDAIPCKGVQRALTGVIAAHPATPVCLFLGAAPASTAGKARRAMQRNQRYVPLGPTAFVPLVAVLWPRAKAEEFLAWTEGKTRALTRADDGNVAKWARRTRQTFMVTVPSLVNHNDEVESTKGGRDSRGESWRTALFMAEDGSLYDW